MRPEDFITTYVSYGVYASIHPAVPSDIHQCAQWTGKWQIKRPQERPLRCAQGHLECKIMKCCWRDISRARKDALIHLKDCGRKDASSNFGITSPASTSPQNRAPLFSSNARAGKLQWSEPDGTNDTHLSLRHFTVYLFSSKHGKKIKVKPKGPREVNLNYLEIQYQYLSTFDNMLIICTPQNSIPSTAIG